ncbi:type IV toxin-antitoxin system AbiEi family antitoxin domain-containing protein [Mesorhizobium shonense]|uniref:type IV toxin-antitoxin system AbiEi family antitoxin domain-containing protein n=1 Tax=Mesorhizobium sp. TaxID=1871066 RepID=UPI00339A7B5C
MPESLETSQRDLAVSLIERHGIMRLSDLKRRGINPATLARLVDEGIPHRPHVGSTNARCRRRHFSFAGRDRDPSSERRDLPCIGAPVS